MKDYKKPHIEVLEIVFEAYCSPTSTGTPSVDGDNPLGDDENYDG